MDIVKLKEELNKQSKEELIDLIIKLSQQLELSSKQLKRSTEALFQNARHS